MIYNGDKSLRKGSKMKQIPRFAFFVTLLFIICSSNAEADWSQRWEQSSTEIWNGQQVGPFDEMAVWTTVGSGMVFQNPAFSDFSTYGWTTYNELGDTSARAFCATPLTYTQLEMNYATQFGVADFLYVCAYQGEVRQRQHITYNSQSGWSYPAFEETDAEWYALGGGNPIPEPLTVISFGGCALLLLLPFKPK